MGTAAGTQTATAAGGTAVTQMSALCRVPPACPPGGTAPQPTTAEDAASTGTATAAKSGTVTTAGMSAVEGITQRTTAAGMTGSLTGSLTKGTKTAATELRWGSPLPITERGRSGERHAGGRAPTQGAAGKPVSRVLT